MDDEQARTAGYGRGADAVREGVLEVCAAVDPLRVAIVCEQYDEARGLDLMVRLYLDYALAGITRSAAVDPRRDRSPSEVCDLVRSSALTVVVLGDEPVDSLAVGPKCAAAILTAQAMRRSYVVLVPFVRWDALAGPLAARVAAVRESDGDAAARLEVESLRFSLRDASGAPRYRLDADEPASVPAEYLNCSVDWVAHKLLGMVALRCVAAVSAARASGEAGGGP